jgi:flavin-binding protein dodecin
MAVKKVIEIMASSPKSWEDATSIAVKTAGKTVKGIKSVYVHHISAVVKDNKIAEYRINAKITFDVLSE